MSKERFLLWMLAGIFAFQAGTLGVGIYYCTTSGGIEACPNLGDRYEQTFNVMIATTLALLTGSALKEK